jgi:hypothetical protein
VRRRVKEDGGVPPRLATFTPADWPGHTVEDRFGLWKEARCAWHDEHGWPGGPLALMRAVSDVRRRLEGRPLLSWGRTPDELARLNGERHSRRREPQ